MNSQGLIHRATERLTRLFRTLVREPQGMLGKGILHFVMGIIGPMMLAGTMASAAAMLTPREFHTATLLPNGWVLIAGGESSSGSGVLASAELFNPATGTFTATGSMNEARFDHTATQLPDGKVLIAGGRGNNGPPASAELFNPATGTFTATGAMRVPRSGHTASLLPSGMVLIAGGTSSASAELFDPARGTFTPTGNMTTARVHHTATLLSNGQVLLAGGWSLNLPVASAEVFNPATGSFTATGPMTRGRVYHSAVRLPNGQVLIAGGGNNSPNLLAMTSAELFNPSTGTFTATGPMTTPRFYHTATVLPNGQVLLAGGKDNIPYDRPPAVAAVAGTERFNPPTGTFTTAGDLAVPRFLHTATLLLNGQVLITGGESSGFVLAGTELVGP